jgi:hypothetical protein
MNDPVEWAKSVAGIVKDYCGRALEPVLARLTAIEQRQPEKGEPGKDGRDGVDGRDGRDAVDGKDGAPGERGADGKDGRDGVDGKDGRDGIDGKSVTVDDVRPIVDEFLKSIPLPQNGRDGERGSDGKSVTVEDVLPHFQQAFDKWALDFERRAQDIHTRLLASFDKPKDGHDGIDGKDGLDGLGFDDLRVEHDGERAFTFICERGEQRKEFTFTVPVVLERGVYKADRTYERGDAVTADGSYWIAQKDAPTGKPGQSPDWRLAVKKGRDGKGS